MASVRGRPLSAQRALSAACLLAALSLSSRAAQRARPAGTPTSGSIVSIIEFETSADGAHVAYLSDPDVPGRFELFGVPTNGSLPPVRLHGPLGDGQSARSFENAPDGRSVVFRIDGATHRVLGLFVAPIDGSAPALQLDAGLLLGDELLFLLIAPDSSRVVYQADQEEPGVFELFSVPLDASAPPQRLNADLPPGGAVDLFAISPRADQVIYSADQETDGVVELYRVAIGGGAPLKLSGALVPGGDVDFFVIEPGGARVVYSADQEVNGRRELYSVPVAGNLAPIKLNGRLTAGGGVFDFRATSDGHRIVYRADQDQQGRLELFSAAIDGHGTPRKLNFASRAVFGFELPPPGGRSAVYVLDRGGFPVSRDLFSVPVDGGDSTQLNPVPTRSGAFSSITPDGKTVVFGASLDLSHFELYSRPIDASSPAVQLTTFATLDHSLMRFVVAPRGDYAVFTGGTGQEGIDDLFSVPIDGSTAPVQLNPIGQSQVSGQFSPTADGTSIVFTNGTNFLYATSIDGAKPLAILND